MYQITGYPKNIIAYTVNKRQRIANLDVPNEIDEIHFTYPEDGNIHYTFKKRKKFWNRVTRNGWRKKFATSDTMLQSLPRFLPEQKLTPSLSDFAKGDKFFAFSNLGFKIEQVPNWRLGWEENVIIDFSKDIILNVEKHPPSTISVSSFLVSKSSPNVNLDFILKQFDNWVTQELPYGNLYLGYSINL